MRNFETQVGRVGLDVLQQGLDTGLQRALRLPQTASPIEGMGEVLNIVTRAGRKRAAQVTEAILKAAPTERERLFSVYAGDVTTYAREHGLPVPFGEKVWQTAERAVNALNVLNRGQEFLVRRAVFQANIAQQLAAQGKDLSRIVAENAVGAIPKDVIRTAVDKALNMTFAETPKQGSMAQAFIQFVNRVPFATTILPFPRFMANSWKFFYEFSPLGLTKLVSPAQRASIAVGNTSTISRAIIGTGMLGAAYQVREQFGGEKWYEVRVGNRTLDTRPYNPFAAYLFVADLSKRYRDGTLKQLTTADIAQGLLSANVRGGTGLAVVDNVLQAMFTPEDRSRLLRAPKEFVGQYAAGFLTPLQQVSDVLGQFSEAMRTIREQHTQPLTGAVKARIPGVAQTLPEAELPTREAPPMRQAPLLRQLTGISIVTPKNPLEHELDRLGLTRSVVQPSTGDAEADRLVAKYMGPLAEQHLVPLTQNQRYLSAPDDLKEGILRQALARVRQAAIARATAEDPKRFEAIRLRHLPGWRRRLLQETATR